MGTLKVQRRDNTGIVFADPSDPDLIVRFKNARSNKTLNGVSTTNYATEIICNDDNVVSIGGVSANDAVSVRIRISGSAASSTRIGVLLTALAAQLPVWQSEGAFVGFEPTTAPVIPAV